MQEGQNTETTVQVENKVSVNTDKNMSSDTRKESTRTYIAQLYVWAFFIVIGIVFVVGMVLLVLLSVTILRLQRSNIYG